MAKFDTSFNFGANSTRKPRKGKGGSKSKGGSKGGRKGGGSSGS